MFNKLFSENCAVYEIMWTTYGRGRQVTDENIIWRMRFPLWIIKATESQSEIKLINYFLPRQQCFANASEYYVYMYIASLVILSCNLCLSLSSSLFLSGFSINLYKALFLIFVMCAPQVCFPLTWSEISSVNSQRSYEIFISQVLLLVAIIFTSFL